MSISRISPRARNPHHRSTIWNLGIFICVLLTAFRIGGFRALGFERGGPMFLLLIRRFGVAAAWWSSRLFRFTPTSFPSTGYRVSRTRNLDDKPYAKVEILRYPNTCREPIFNPGREKKITPSLVATSRSTIWGMIRIIYTKIILKIYLGSVIHFRTLSPSISVTNLKSGIIRRASVRNHRK